MIHISVTNEHLLNAENLFDFKKLNNSITDGDGNLAGALGEVIVCEYYNCKQENTYNYDLTLNSIKIDVKTKRFTSKFTPSKNWNLNISDFNIKQKCDYYCFVGISDDYKEAYIYGFICKDDFFKLARFGKKNDIDPFGNGRWKYRANCYNMLISELNQFEEIINETNISNFAYVESDCVNELEVNDDVIKINQENISEYIQLSLF